ncbi:TonB-dependent receptor [Cytophagales bacterium LB-30]|uniref:TonB-dependent receptor n=1 Tax=Shiella aurantiaca TaxID=3058365 RepID=A0ABT8F0N8_9BACT|nr:TonB-dependent receptor [Shiella aurantiaca]MDN4164011.1 TonB-dependent receptor [Shiella aurantiaca]
MHKILAGFFLFLGLSSLSFAQQTFRLQGVVLDSAGMPLAQVSVREAKTQKGTATDSLGQFSFRLPADTYQLTFSSVGYQSASQEVVLRQDTRLQITLNQAIQVLSVVEVKENRVRDREENSLYTIDPIQTKRLPSAFGDFSKVIATLPGVVANNELSASYSVRGGNFDENLIYVNGFEVYRPFLVRAGQQEGLSFVNPDLVEKVEFSSGGWQPAYGDKLSSVLTIQYKKPEKAAGSVLLGLLGGTGHLEGVKGKRISYLMGLRHKRSTYLLNTLETQGQYLPNFTDFQGLVHIDLDKDPEDKKDSDTELSLLFSYARNRYLVVPSTRETEFGTFNQAFRLLVAFDGRELMEYDTYQGGVSLTRKVNQRLKHTVLASVVATREREYLDIEGGYRLCDVDKNTSSSTFNECIRERGIGTNYLYARNRLFGRLFTIEERSSYSSGKIHKVEWGISYSYQKVDDLLNEYAFVDSSDYVSVTYAINSEYQMRAHKASAFVQHTVLIGAYQTLTYGIRALYWGLGNDFLVSPRIQYAFRPQGREDWTLRFSAGAYHQTPFYRELRNQSGQVNEDVKPQRSYHFIAGSDYQFMMWGRTFKFLSEAYYKILRDVIPYEVNNVRIRYFGENMAKAYALGADFRVNGEFIPGTESWFSLGILQTKEDVENDGKGYIRRPSDQRITAAIFFQDHLPNNPSMRVNVNVQYGSGLPFGPPEDPANRSVFKGRPYARVDIGFSKEFDFLLKKPEKKGIKNIWLGAEILNLLGNDNVISYTWIKDVTSTTFAIPNSLSARFLNVKMVVRF